MDRFGIIDETYMTLRYPRAVDETAPTFESAMAEAASMLLDGAKRVSICTVQFRGDEPYERDTIVSIDIYEDAFYDAVEPSEENEDKP